jgi:hypothetical protein
MVLLHTPSPLANPDNKKQKAEKNSQTPDEGLKSLWLPYASMNE